MKRTACGSCGSDDLLSFLDLGSTPIADAYVTTPHEVTERHPLELAVCTSCWLVQLLEVVDHKTLFGTGYSFYSSASAPLSAYHERYARDVLRRHGELARRFTVEIGCNDGDMLRHFDAAGCRTLGVDPARGPTDVAGDRGLRTIVTSFGAEVAIAVRDEEGPAGIIIANHVLAHVEDVADVLAGVAKLLADDGLAFIEVQYLPDLLLNNAFDLVYHEHRNFFSLSSLEQAAARWGLHIIDAELTDRQGGSLRVALTHARRPRAYVDDIRTSESWLTQPGAYAGFQGRVERVRSRLLDLIHTERGAGRRIVGYGAPAKATTLLNFCGLDAELIDRVTDTTAAKQGRYIPGTGLRIVAPGEVKTDEVDTYLLLAWNYTSQILRNHTFFTQTGGRWILPLPVPVLL